MRYMVRVETPEGKFVSDWNEQWIPRIGEAVVIPDAERGFAIRYRVKDIWHRKHPGERHALTDGTFVYREGTQYVSIHIIVFAFGQDRTETDKPQEG